MVLGARRADVRRMRPLAPAVTELRVAGGAVVVCAVALAGVTGGVDDPAAAGLGLAGAVLAFWLPRGAAAVGRAIRLALPARPRWELEATGATVRRVLVTQAAPCGALAVLAVAAGGGHPAVPDAVAGALAGVGVCGLLAAARIRRAERALGRRLLRQPRWGRLLDRRALFLEPSALSGRPAGAAASPWPAHRPPSHAPGAAIELDPANAPAVHPVGVGLRARRAPRRQPPGSGS